jgi:hypothetical protein
MDFSKYISYRELAEVLNTVKTAIVKSNFSHEKSKLLIPWVKNPHMQKLLHLARDVDNSITLKKNGRHGPARLASFQLSYYGEHALDGIIITILDDDEHNNPKFSHHNTYKLKLHDKETHDKLFFGDPESGMQHDFDAEFLYQITYDKETGLCYPTTVRQEYISSDGSKKLTKGPWDSFTQKKYGESREDLRNLSVGYRDPIRRFEFKSALWTSGDNTHNANYVFKIDKAKHIQLINVSDFAEHDFVIENVPDQECMDAMIHEYYMLLRDFSVFNGYSWEDFIIDE